MAAPEDLPEIMIDPRTGSGDLYPLLAGAGLPCKRTQLHFGDVAFLGNGPDDCPVSVGVEVKTLNDVLNSIVSGRFSGHQLIGLSKCYQSCWLLVEGVWKADPDTDAILVPRGKGNWVPIPSSEREWKQQDLESWFLTIQNIANVKVKVVERWPGNFPGCRKKAVDFLQTLYRWWTHKRWDEHSSHKGMYQDKKKWQSTMEFQKPTLARLVAAQLPGIGYDKSYAATMKFPSVLEMVNASAAMWDDVDGVGKIISQRVYKAIRAPDWRGD